MQGAGGAALALPSPIPLLGSQNNLLDEPQSKEQPENLMMRSPSPPYMNHGSPDMPQVRLYSNLHQILKGLSNVQCSYVDTCYSYYYYHDHFASLQSAGHSAFVSDDPCNSAQYEPNSKPLQMFFRSLRVPIVDFDRLHELSSASVCVCSL